MLLQRNPPLVRSIPPDTPHSVIHSLPTWQDNVDRAMGKPGAVPLMETTYPRFVVHPFIRPLIELVLESLKAPSEQTCLLFPSPKLAKAFCSFMHLQFPSSPKTEPLWVTETVNAPQGNTVFAVLFHVDQRMLAMKFWMFSGAGISIRLAENCLNRLNGRTEETLGLPSEPGHEYESYYSSHTALSSVSEAKARIKTRVAGINADGTNIRGVEGLKTSDAFLYSSGMSAIWYAYHLLHDALECGENHKSVHVNILYVDSYKLLDTSQSEYFIFTNNNLNDLEKLLEGSASSVLGIFTDFPGNPHLRSADLPRLRAIADKYQVPVIIDETIGCHLNVSVLPYADIVVCSLTKFFSGFANVLGGALLLNPSSQFYTTFKTYLDKNYEDNYCSWDALVMELNSRGLEERLIKINKNTELLADWLFERSKAGGKEDTVLEEVFYPKYQYRENYEHCMRVVSEGNGIRPGYSGLVALSFTSLEAAKTFYESMQCYKGTTLGTVVTLLSPFIAIAFPPEKMDWVREHEMTEALVRFSVGVEDISRILNSVEAALFTAEKC